MRLAAKVDGNHTKIVRGLRQLGATVEDLSRVGHGCPDILVGCYGRNWLLEIKNPEQAPSKRKLTGDEPGWHERWRGQCAVVYTLDDAIAIVFG